MSYETRYAAMIRQRSDWYASSPESAVARVRLQEAMALARADVQHAYPVITPDNFAAAAEYQQERIDHHRQAMSA